MPFIALIGGVYLENYDFPLRISNGGHMIWAFVDMGIPFSLHGYHFCKSWRSDVLKRTMEAPAFEFFFFKKKLTLPRNEGRFAKNKQQTS